MILILIFRKDRQFQIGIFKLPLLNQHFEWLELDVQYKQRKHMILILRRRRKEYFTQWY